MCSLCSRCLHGHNASLSFVWFAATQVLAFLHKDVGLDASQIRTVVSGATARSVSSQHACCGATTRSALLHTGIVSWAWPFTACHACVSVSACCCVCVCVCVQITRFPHVFSYNVKGHLAPQLAYLQSLGVDREHMAEYVCARPLVLGEVRHAALHTRS